jgi:hypothetical protein
LEEKMSREVELKDAVPIIHVNASDAQLSQFLLEGQFVGYHDVKYGVTSGDHHIVMKLLSHEDHFVLFYLHVPFAYPIPEGVKDTVKSAVEASLQRTIQKMEFINSGTELEKMNIQFRVELGGQTE